MQVHRLFDALGIMEREERHIIVMRLGKPPCSGRQRKRWLYDATNMATGKLSTVGERWREWDIS